MRDPPALGVSREARADIEAYWVELLRWNRRLNLIGPGTVAYGWTRHIEDSLQLLPLFPANAVVHLDLGSGGGLPAVPVALARRDAFEDHVILVEADRRKAAFLRRICDRHLPRAAPMAVRAEALEPQRAAIVTARAVAPLRRLLDLVSRHLAEDGIAILPKGRSAREEIDVARADWRFDHDIVPSGTSADGSVLVLSNVRRRG